MYILLMIMSAWAQSIDPVEVSPTSDEVPAAIELVEEPAAPPAPSFPGQVGPSSPHYDLEELYHNAQYEKGLELVRARRKSAPDDVVLSWMEVRFMFEIAELKAETTSRKDRVAWYDQMIALSEAALAKHPDDAHLHFAHSVSIGRWGTARGVLASLRVAKKLESAMLRTVRDGFAYRSIGGEEHLPCDGYLVLSIYYRLVPDSWVVQLLAGTRGSLAKSLKYSTKAHQCSPDSIKINKEFGVSQLCKGQTDGNEALIAGGRATLARIASLEPRMATDHVDKLHARVLLAEPERACGYSRDGDQDLDTKALEMQNSDAE